MPAYLARVFRPIGPLIVRLLPFGLALVYSLLGGTFFVPSLPREVSVFLLMLGPLPLLGMIGASLVLAVLCVGRSWRC